MSVANAFFSGMENPYAMPAGQPPRQRIGAGPSAPQAPFSINNSPMLSAVTNGDGVMASGVTQDMMNRMFTPNPRKLPRWAQPVGGQNEPGGPFRIPNEPLQPIGP